MGLLLLFKASTRRSLGTPLHTHLSSSGLQLISPSYQPERDTRRLQQRELDNSRHAQRLDRREPDSGEPRGDGETLLPTGLTTT